MSSKIPSIPPAVAGKSTLLAAVVATLTWWASHQESGDERLRILEANQAELRGEIRVQSAILGRIEKRLDAAFPDAKAP